MIWFWGRWNYPFASGSGFGSLIINIFLVVLYIVMELAILTLLIAALGVLAVAFFPCWIWFIFI